MNETTKPETLWKMMPSEPTDEMWMAGSRALASPFTNLHTARGCYKAMWEAAPTLNEPLGEVPPTQPAGITPFNPLNAASNMGQVFTGIAPPWDGEAAPTPPAPPQLKEFEQLLCRYWDAAFAEGQDGRTHDTKDAIAQRTLRELRAMFKGNQIPPAPEANSMEPVATVSIDYFRGNKGMANTDFQLLADLPEGTHTLCSAEQIAQLQAHLTAKSEEGERLRGDVKAIRLQLIDEILDFIAQESAKEKPRMWAKFHTLRQQIVSKFGCNTKDATN